MGDRSATNEEGWEMPARRRSIVDTLDLGTVPGAIPSTIPAPKNIGSSSPTRTGEGGPRARSKTVSFGGGGSSSAGKSSPWTRSNAPEGQAESIELLAQGLGSRLQRAATEAQLQLYQTLEDHTFTASGPSAAMYDVWKSLDNNGNGRLSREEFNEVNRRLKVKWDTAAAWRDSLLVQAVEDMDAQVREKLARADRGEPEPERRSDESLLKCEQPEIGFRSFVSVYNQIMGAKRRQDRSSVKARFETAMRSSRGLNKAEVEQLVQRVQKQLHLLEPPYERETDWALMLELSGCAEDDSPGAEERYVDFTQFERWWKHRVGLLEADTPVIPEFFEYKMAEMSEAQKQKARQQQQRHLAKLPSSFTIKVRGKSKKFDALQLARNGFVDTRRGSELWDLMRSRLRMMMTMRRDWGAIDDVYGHGRSDYGNYILPWYVRDPNSKLSLWWDVVQVIFLVYVTTTVPLRACFGIDIELFSGTWVFDEIVNGYFVADLVLNFFTAFYDPNGVREIRLVAIRKRYLQRWFAVDFLSIMPINYILMAVETEDSRSNANDTLAEGEASDSNNSDLSALKALRLFRFSKMLRLARVKRILAKYEEMEIVQAYAGMGGLLFVVVFAAHILACLWYLIGVDDTSFLRGRPEPGWVLFELCADECALIAEVWAENPPLCHTYAAEADCPDARCSWGAMDDWGFTDDVPGCYPRKLCQVGCEVDAGVSLSWRYFTSMWYVFGSLDPKNRTLTERAFAIFAYFVMVIIDGAVAGVLASVMIRMGGKDQEIHDKLKAAKMWMREHRIPKAQANKALDYFRLVYKSRVMYEEADILKTMPPAMKLEFSTQLYEKFLSDIPLFRGLATSLIHSLCSIVEPMMAVRHQVIYTEGSTGKEMYMLLSGELEITARGERLGFLSDGAFFGETPILDSSATAEVRRRTVQAMVDSKLCYIHKDHMQQMASRYPELALRLKRCARTETKVNKKGRKFMAAMQEASAVKSTASVVKRLNLLPQQRKGSRSPMRASPGSSPGAASPIRSGGGGGDEVANVMLGEAVEAELKEHRLMLERMMLAIEELAAKQGAGGDSR